MDDQAVITDVNDVVIHVAEILTVIDVNNGFYLNVNDLSLDLFDEIITQHILIGFHAKENAVVQDILKKEDNTVLQDVVAIVEIIILAVQSVEPLLTIITDNNDCLIQYIIDNISLVNNDENNTVTTSFEFFYFNNIFFYGFYFQNLTYIVKLYINFKPNILSTEYLETLRHQPLLCFLSHLQSKANSVEEN